MTRFLNAAAVIAAAAFVLPGCGGGTGTLTGKVTYQGKPVVSGSVLVRSADGSQRAGNIETDGSYTVLVVPTGPVKIAVLSPEPASAPAAPRPLGREREKAAQPPPPVDRSKWIKLPDQFSNPETSGQTATVTSGTTTFDIELK